MGKRFDEFAEIFPVYSSFCMKYHTKPQWDMYIKNQHIEIYKMV